MIEANEEQSQNHHQDRWLSMIRSQWHEWANALQVLLGYIQLDRGPEAKQYILQMARKLHDSQAFINIPPSDVSAFLLSYVAMPLPYEVRLQGNYTGCIPTMQTVGTQLVAMIRTFLYACERAAELLDGTNLPAVLIQLDSHATEWSLTFEYIDFFDHESILQAMMMARTDRAAESMCRVQGTWYCAMESRVHRVQWMIREDSH